MISSLVHDVYAIFARPEPVLGLALSRIALGAVLAYDGARMLREHDVWYGDDALRPRRSALPSALDAFAWAERLGGSSRTVLHVLIGSALFFACGLATELSGVVLLVCVVAVAARNPFVAYGGDAFACAVLFLLLCSPCAAAASIDRWLEDGTFDLHAQASPWGGRLIRFEVALLYFGNFLAKLRSPAWRRGTTMFELLRNRNFARADVPTWLMRRDVARLATWSALATELALGPALLFPPTAAIACAVAIAFHLTIARLVDVHLFSAVMIAALLACWPAGGGTLPTPPLDGAHAMALGLVLAYLAFAVACDLAGRVRGWRMFTSSTPYIVEIEITIVDGHGDVDRWIWQPQRGHRFQRFVFSLLREPEARRRLVDRFRADLRRTGRSVRAWSIDALYLDVHDGTIVNGTNVGRAELGGGSVFTC